MDDEELLRNCVTNLASKYGRYGYKRITALLKQEGWKVNHKRVFRIWREEGLKVPAKQSKKARLILLSKSGHKESDEYNHFWRCSAWERSAINIQKSIKFKQSV
jgi:transposase InsO family protein